MRYDWLLRQRKVALFCSTRCPGELEALRDAVQQGGKSLVDVEGDLGIWAEEPT